MHCLHCGTTFSVVGAECSAVTSHDHRVNIKHDPHQPCKTVTNKIQVIQVLNDIASKAQKGNIININLSFINVLSRDGTEDYLKSCIYL